MCFPPHKKCLSSLEDGLENPRKRAGTRGKKVSLKLISVKDGAEKRTETRHSWKNARRQPDICCVILQMSGSLLVFFHLCLVSAFFFSSVLNWNELLENFLLLVYYGRFAVTTFATLFISMSVPAQLLVNNTSGVMLNSRNRLTSSFPNQS